LDNIFGVDIDSQAVETTKLSLLLKVLEGETQQSLQPVLRLFHERALPDLGDNIKCGNSLIGPDFYQQQQMSLLDEEERYRVNVFDWHAEFPQIFRRRNAPSELRDTPAPPLDYTAPGVPLHGRYGYKKVEKAPPPPWPRESDWEGGFDVVIGNPPYGADLTSAESAYLREQFDTATKDLDTYTLFMEKAVTMIKPGGRFSMIVPTGWYSGPKFSALRRFVACTTDPDSFVNLPYDVFKAWVDTTIFAVVKRAKPAPWPPKDQRPVTIITFPKRHRITSPKEFEGHASKAEFSAWFADGGDEYLSYADAQSTALIRKILAIGRPLGEMADVQRGVTPFNLSEDPVHPKSRPAFNGTVRRYTFHRGEKRFIRFDDTLAEPKPERYFMGPRLLLRELISRQFQLQAVMVTDDFVTNKSMQSILPVPNGPDLGYLLGILNSRLMSWFFLHRSNIAQRDDFPKIVLKETRSLPIPPADLSRSTPKSRHGQIVQLVEQMLALQQRLFAAKTPQEKTALERQIAATDTQIDRLVYDLYGLTQEDIKIVEGALA
jgi:predicted RNA methylase